MEAAVHYGVKSRNFNTGISILGHFSDLETSPEGSKKGAVYSAISINYFVTEVHRA
jgi:hypothetical protein